MCLFSTAALLERSLRNEIARRIDEDLDRIEITCITGTEPKSFCTIHKFEKQRNNELLQRLQENLFDNL